MLCDIKIEQLVVRTFNVPSTEQLVAISNALVRSRRIDIHDGIVRGLAEERYVSEQIPFGSAFLKRSYFYYLSSVTHVRTIGR